MSDPLAHQLPLEISCENTRRLLETAPSTVWLLDCRESDEFAFAAIPGAQLIPMGEIAQRVGEIAAGADRQIVVCCHHGVRSLRAANFLRQQGIAGVQSMAGGIDEWSRTIDATIPRY